MLIDKNVHVGSQGIMLTDTTLDLLSNTFDQTLLNLIGYTPVMYATDYWKLFLPPL